MKNLLVIFGLFSVLAASVNTSLLGLVAGGISIPDTYLIAVGVLNGALGAGYLYLTTALGQASVFARGVTKSDASKILRGVAPSQSPPSASKS